MSQPIEIEAHKSNRRAKRSGEMFAFTVIFCIAVAVIGLLIVATYADKFSWLK